MKPKKATYQIINKGGNYQILIKAQFETAVEQHHLENKIAWFLTRLDVPAREPGNPDTLLESILEGHGDEAEAIMDHKSQRVLQRAIRNRRKERKDNSLRLKLRNCFKF